MSTTNEFGPDSGGRVKVRKLPIFVTSKFHYI